jgi:hypothetical protein
MASAAVVIDRPGFSGFYFSPMKRFAALAAAAMTCFAAAMVSSFATTPELRRPLDHADVLPLALDDHFQFRKVEQFLNDPSTFKPSPDEMIQFERQRVDFKAVTNVDRLERRGHYFTFFWRANRPSPLTVRFEYRQANLGSYVQAREVSYDRAKGSMETKFEVIGDDYTQDGRITAWRALLIQDGKIVGFTQSYLWQ